MSRMLQLDAPPAGGLFGTLRAWLRARSNELQAPCDAAADDEVRPSTRADGSVCVLVVDDNPVNLALMSALMQSRGVLVFLAADGGEAVALACELQFDLILMDLQMPILDGFGATLAIRCFERSSRRAAAPVLAYSSAAPADPVLAAHGIDGILGKPCGDRELEDCLVRWCPPYRALAAQRGAACDALRRPRAHRGVATVGLPQPLRRSTGLRLD